MADDEDDEKKDSGLFDLLVGAAVFLGHEIFAKAQPAHFEDDSGHWTDDHYSRACAAIFGEHPHFGDSWEARFLEAGLELVSGAVRDRFHDQLEALSPGLSEMVDLFNADGQHTARGIIRIDFIDQLQKVFPDIDLSGLHVTVPRSHVTAPDDDDEGERPEHVDSATVQQAVDLRKFASEIGDQGQTSRCMAFAWTHAMELIANMHGKPFPRLCPNFTMYQLQRLQGDARDWAWAQRGGEGACGGVRAGRSLLEHGTCRKQLWPDEAKRPTVDEPQLDRDAKAYRLTGKPFAVEVEELKQVLSAGCPVQISMTTGDAFGDIGRDGVIKVAENPKGDHGWHAMLCVGYLGNHFIIKNSWGKGWGDQGYCYAPRRILDQLKARDGLEMIAIGTSAA